MHSYILRTFWCKFTFSFDKVHLIVEPWASECIAAGAFTKKSLYWTKNRNNLHIRLLNLNEPFWFKDYNRTNRNGNTGQDATRSYSLGLKSCCSLTRLVWVGHLICSVRFVFLGTFAQLRAYVSYVTAPVYVCLSMCMRVCDCVERSLKRCCSVPHWVVQVCVLVCVCVRVAVWVCDQNCLWMRFLT